MTVGLPDLVPLTRWRVSTPIGRPLPSRVIVTDAPNAEQQNLYVNNDFDFDVNESNASSYADYESYVVATMMQNLVRGKGPEHYTFPENGIKSHLFR
jgi:hypothetical protein